MRKLILSLILLISTKLIACDCLWHGSFLDTDLKNDIIFRGKVVGYDIYQLIIKEDTSYYLPTVLIVEIKEILYLEKDTTINLRSFFINEGYKSKVLCNRGGNCMPSASTFELNSEWVFQLNKAKAYNYYNIDYTISDCATNYIKYENGKVFGNIEGKNQEFRSDGVNIEMDYDVFKEKVLNPAQQHQ